MKNLLFIFNIILFIKLKMKLIYFKIGFQIGQVIEQKKGELNNILFVNFKYVTNGTFQLRLDSSVRDRIII